MTIKLSLQQKQDKELTFHPQLPNKNSSIYASNSEFFNRSKSTIKRTERSMSNRQLQECTFKPKIHSHQQSTGNIHEKLYSQAIIKQKTSKKSDDIKKNEKKKIDPQVRNASITRLLNSHIVTDAKINKSKESSIDFDSNQSLFHPKICREPYVPLEKPVWDRLYSSEIVEPIINSEDIYKNFKKLQYKQLFLVLDNDHDSFITKKDIDSELLDSRSRALLSKVFNSNGLQNEMSFDVFSEVLEKNINYFTMEDRMWLLRRNNCCR